jgi:hypothetical protein
MKLFCLLIGTQVKNPSSFAKVALHVLGTSNNPNITWHGVHSSLVKFITRVKVSKSIRSNEVVVVVPCAIERIT